MEKNDIPLALLDQSDAMLCAMQTPQHAAGIDALFNATSEALGAAATRVRLNASEFEQERKIGTARIVRVLVRATEVLGDRERAKRWMTRPHEALNGKMPIEVAQDPATAELALNLLS